MTPLECFRINSPNVIHEIIDGEAVLVRLDTGSYYSIDKAGAEIWSFIENGATVNQIIEEISNRYVGNHGDIQNGVNQIVSKLQQEGLIVPDKALKEENRRATQNPGAATAVINEHTEKPHFEVPTLHKYTDMEDLLLLDPIHDVDETGWPSTKPKTSN